MATWPWFSKTEGGWKPMMSCSRPASARASSPPRLASRSARDRARLSHADHETRHYHALFDHLAASRLHDDPTAGGIRVGGNVELAGLDAPRTSAARASSSVTRSGRFPFCRWKTPRTGWATAGAARTIRSSRRPHVFPASGTRLAVRPSGAALFRGDSRVDGRYDEAASRPKST